MRLQFRNIVTSGLGNDLIHRFYQDVFFLQSVIHFYETHVQVI